MKKTTFTRRLFTRAALAWMVSLILSLVLPPLFHKETSTHTTRTAPGTDAGTERVLSIDNNTDALLWRLRLIDLAQSRLVLTTFDFCDDNSGLDIMSALFCAADRGVNVQILVDGIYGALHAGSSRHFKELASHEHVEIKFYNPITLLFPWKNNYRMHDKYLIADDFAYLLGGRNTDDLFLGSYVETYNEDRDILVYETVPGKGRSLMQLEKYFQEIWNQPCSQRYTKRTEQDTGLKKHYGKVKETYPQAYGPIDWEGTTMPAKSIELCSNPIHTGNKEPILWERMIREMSVCQDILIQSPYIICSEKMYQDLADVCAHASTADLIINAVESGSNPFGCTDYLNQKKQVQKTGLCTYEYLGSQALHTKTVVAGDCISIVGSCNFDMRSVYLDTELMLIIDSPPLNAALREQISALKEKSRKVLPNGDVIDGKEYMAADQSIGKKIFYGILRAVILPFRHLLDASFVPSRYIPSCPMAFDSSLFPPTGEIPAIHSSALRFHYLQRRPT